MSRELKLSQHDKLTKTITIKKYEDYNSNNNNNKEKDSREKIFSRCFLIGTSGTANKPYRAISSTYE